MTTRDGRDFRKLFERAEAAGHAAAAAIATHGPCGFAWVTVRPGNSPAARYAQASLGAWRGYRGGMEVWVRGYGQSMARKETYAEAFAAELRLAGVDAVAGSRMD